MFCATRLGLEAGTSTQSLQRQRRYLQSSEVLRKPPAAAEAVQEEDEAPEYQPGPRETPRFGGGWARSTFSSTLTPEEERQRQALEKDRAAAEAPPHSQIPKANGLSSRPLIKLFKSNGIQSDPPTENSSTQKLSRRPIRSSLGFGVPVRRERGNVQSTTPADDEGSLPATKHHRHINIEHTPSTVKDYSYNPEIASGWQHVRRRGDGATQLKDGQGVVQQGRRDALSEMENEIDEAFNKARLEREKQSKKGQFVGFSDGKIPEESRYSQRSDHHIARQEESFLVGARAPKPVAQKVPLQKFRRVNPNAAHIQVSAESETDTRTLRGTQDRQISRSWGQWSPAQHLPERSPSQDLEAKEEVQPPQQTLPGAKSQTWTQWSPMQPPLENTPIKDLETEEIVPGIQRTSTAEEDIEELQRQERQRRRAAKFAIDMAQVQVHEDYSNRRERQQRRRADRFDPEAEEEREFGERHERERRRQRKQEKAVRRAAATPIPIYLPEFISVSNLATALKVKLDEFVSTIQSMGFEGLSNDHVLDGETAGLIAAEYNYDPIIDKSESEDLQARPPPADKSLLPSRPPVVTIMGHVDHGKTTLLDWLRKSSVAASEHGGITQHIGAFSVPMPSGKIITFLDTPGHAAFLSMRQRGANVTDIVILVVAADDSVKPQTIEAIKHAKAANVPMIVAVNKIDKEEANVELVKQDLARHGVEIEDFGGDTQVVCVSGKTGQGMEQLEEAAVTLADILDMRAETDGPAEGWVLEGTTKKSGRVATVLVRRGTMRRGDIIVAGSTWARIRSLRNEAGVQIAAAGPGTPVEIDGWREQPAAGDEVLEAPNEQRAKAVVEKRRERSDRLKMAADMEAVNDSRRHEQDEREREKQLEDTDNTTEPSAPPLPQTPGIKEVYFIIKADVSGSVEAVVNSVTALGNAEVRPHILRSGVGPVTEFDIEHAAVAKGHIISFNLPQEPNISRLAESNGVSVLSENIIYRLVDEIKGRLSEYLSPLVTQRVVGEAEVAQVFEIRGKGKSKAPVAGCKVRNGVVGKGWKAKVLRGSEVVYDGMFLILVAGLKWVEHFANVTINRNVVVVEECQKGRYRDAEG